MRDGADMVKRKSHQPAHPLAQPDDKEQRLIMLGIAAILDYPSVYMGGPSPRSQKIADSIVKRLLHEKRLVSTYCDHADYGGYEWHGAYCPRCGMNMAD